MYQCAFCGSVSWRLQEDILFSQPHLLECPDCGYFPTSLKEIPRDFL
ncbi:MAG: hypothetical protein ACE5K0_00445 [Candidatus Methanofastidiosia archaeon]